MASKMVKQTTSVYAGTKKKTSIGRTHSMIGFGTMNKAKRRSYKKYRGQGR